MSRNATVQPSVRGLHPERRVILVQGDEASVNGLPRTHVGGTSGSQERSQVTDAVHDLATLFPAQLSHEFKYVVQVQRHQLVVRVWSRHCHVSCLMVWGHPVSPGSHLCPG